MKKNIAIIMGGYSSEINISITSGNIVYKHLNKEKYNSFRVLILKEKWVVLDAEENEYSINKNNFSFIFNGNKVLFDCVFNCNSWCAWRKRRNISLF